MEREIDLAEISDGRLYNANDMVKAGCHDCAGCFACCRGMGTSIILDPMDIYRMSDGLHRDFMQLLEESLELTVVEGIIQPNIRMQGENEQCVYLSENGRCGIHEFRPGFCRMFPLGRIYENGRFRYFLQVHECVKQVRTKVKVRKWIGIPNIEKYECYITDWHYFLKHVQEWFCDMEDEQIKKYNLYLLHEFYKKPYEAADFYGQFYERMQNAKEAVTSV
ncbi:MAG TPA: YkgJ family cysteine cluster protein [Lachnospiraceae bacterium]|nr:YkgJ family cysteine cluster protein [Lachnospiraceae bacterium]